MTVRELITTILNTTSNLDEDIKVLLNFRGKSRKDDEEYFASIYDVIPYPDGISIMLYESIKKYPKDLNDEMEN